MTDTTSVEPDSPAPTAPAAQVGSPAEQRRDAIGWGRALGSAVVIVLIGFLGAVWLPDVLLKQLSVGRDTAAVTAAGVSILVVVAMAWGLRRLQAGGRI